VPVGLNYDEIDGVFRCVGRYATRMSQSNVRYEIEGGVATLTIDRPKALNALDVQTVNEIGACLDGLDADARVLVVTGAGEKAFVAGADIKGMTSMSAQEAVSFSKATQEVMTRIEHLPIPVIAAVDGFALGGGCELAMCCDFIIASERAQFGQPEVAIGLIPGFAGTVRLSRKVGPGWARRLIVTGERIDAETSFRIGLVTEVVPSGQALSRAQELGATIAKNAPRAIALAKECCLFGEERDAAGAAAYERNAFGLVFTTEDRVEGLSAFIEKRSPTWKGR